MGIRDVLSNMFNKKEENVGEQAQQFTYTAKKGSLIDAQEKGMSVKAKAVISALIVAGTLGLSGMAPSDAHAAGKMRDVYQPKNVQVLTAKDLERGNKAMKEIERTNAFLRQAGVDMEDGLSQGARDFRKNLDPNNPMYSHDSEIESQISASGAKIRGNVRIGNQDYSNGRW